MLSIAVTELEGSLVTVRVQRNGYKVKKATDLDVSMAMLENNAQVSRSAILRCPLSILHFPFTLTLHLDH